jgi:hypothetical protein
VVYRRAGGETVRFVLAFVAAVAGVVGAAAPAFAGGWAVTLLDPLPDRIESGHAYTAGYWVLQHGSHPSEIPLGNTGLRFVDGSGQTVTFAGVALAEPAHFAAAFVLPHDGAWDLYGLQGVFQPHEIGTVTVPGRLAVLPTPTPLQVPGNDEHAWGAIHPPQVVAGPAREPVAGGPPAATQQGRSDAAVQTGADGSPLPAGLLAMAAAVAVFAAGLAALGHRMRRPALPKRSHPGG